MSTTGHIPEPGSLEWVLSTNVFNIVLVALILGWVIGKFKLLDAFPQQQAQIRQEVEALEQQKRQAETLLAELKQRTANLSTEIDAILAQAKTAAEGLSQQIITDARVQAEKVIEASHKRIVVEEKAAVQALQSRLLADAVSDARDQLASASDAERRQSVESFLNHLSQVKVS